MKIELLSLDQIVFIDVNGVARRSRGCSLRGLEEFNALYERMQDILKEAEDGKTLKELYFKNEQFRYCSDRALELNGIKPEWINLTILTALLFAYEGEVGLLIRLNLPNKLPDKAASAESSNAIASLVAATGSLSEAIKLSENVPWKILVEAMESKQSTPRPKKDPRDRSTVLKEMMAGVAQINNKRRE